MKYFSLLVVIIIAINYFSVYWQVVGKFLLSFVQSDKSRIPQQKSSFLCCYAKKMPAGLSARLASLPY